MSEGPHIGRLREKSLHAALKDYYANPGDQHEVPINGYVIDLVAAGTPPLLIEIQTGSFSHARRKLAALVGEYPVRLVYPIAAEKWIVRAPDDTAVTSRRKSPRRGTIYDVFSEWVACPSLLLHPNFSLEVVLVRVEEWWRNDGQGSWRRKRWSISDRRLLDVVDRHIFASVNDMRALLPDTFPSEFTTADLADALHIDRRLAGQMAYCLREMGIAAPIGKRSRAILYALEEREAEKRGEQQDEGQHQRAAEHQHDDEQGYAQADRFHSSAPFIQDDTPQS